MDSRREPEVLRDASSNLPTNGTTDSVETMLVDQEPEVCSLLELDEYLS